MDKMTDLEIIAYLANKFASDSQFRNRIRNFVETDIAEIKRAADERSFWERLVETALNDKNDDLVQSLFSLAEDRSQYFDKTQWVPSELTQLERFGLAKVINSPPVVENGPYGRTVRITSAGDMVVGRIQTALLEREQEALERDGAPAP